MRPPLIQVSNWHSRLVGILFVSEQELTRIILFAGDLVFVWLLR
jgi:hypothetical protein